MDVNKQLNDITSSNQLESPLLRLPGEVRNRIYEYVLGGHHISFQLGRTYCLDHCQNSQNPMSSFRGAKGAARRLLFLTETCRQVHTETKLHIFNLNDFRLPGTHHLKIFISILSPRQLEAIKTYVWPQRCDLVENELLLKLTGLQRIIVLKAAVSGQDFYVPAGNATAKVHSWYAEKRRAAQEKLDGWRAKGIKIEYYR